MISIEFTQTTGWEAAIRGMRNPMNSWDKTDSVSILGRHTDYGCIHNPSFILGENDKNLAMKLCSGGADDRKFLRMIVVYCDITAPFYWWKEFDTYKVGTVANSCSTMHTLHKRDITLDDFSCEDLSPYAINILEDVISDLNVLRMNYVEHKNKDSWREMIQMLPTSFNQKRTVMMNYEVLRNMYNARRNHKLSEWHEFCDWIERLPYSELIINNSKRKKRDKNYEK